MGYNLNLPSNLFDEVEELYKGRKKLYDDNKKQVINELSNFVKGNGALNGAELERTWFPQINADIFISHSHKDEK